MNQIRITLAAAAILMVGVASQAFASGRPASSSHASHAQVNSSYRSNSYSSHASYNYGRSYNSSYHTTYGTRFSYGYYYRGRNHSHWTYTRFDPRYGCTCYYDPCCNSWYYWCQPASCYYPVSYRPYNTYCWDGCSSGIAVQQVAPVQGPVGPGPVNAGPVSTPQGDGPPSIPAPIATPGRN